MTGVIGKMYCKELALVAEC